MAIFTQVETKLQDIFKRRVGLDFTKHPELKGLKLLGDEIGLPPRELMLLLYNIENEFRINILKQIVVDGKFDSYVHILDAVADSL